MVSHLFYYQLAVLALVWLCIMLHLTWPKRGMITLAAPARPRRQRATEPKPFDGLTKKPHCALCERDTASPKPSPPVPSDPMPRTNRRPREVDTSQHFCPHAGCDYWGWLGLAGAGQPARQWPSQ